MQTQTTHPLELEVAKLVASNPSDKFFLRAIARFLTNLKSSDLDGEKLAECFANAVKSLEN